MSSDNDGGISFALPGEVDDWLASEARRRDETRDDVCRRLVTAAHAVATDDEIEPGDLDDLTAVQAQLDAQRDEFTELLEDVRGRVIQVKRETDGKAPAEHDHDGYAATDDLEALRDDLEALETTVDDGFANFEDALEGLLEEVTDHEDRLALLANAVVDLREQRDAAAQRERRRAAADQLKRAANQLGVRTGACEACNGRVDIALLTEPECPHCATELSDVAEKTSLFGSHTLETGDRPALDGHVEPTAGETDDGLFDAVADDAAADDGDDSRTTVSFDADGSIR